MGPAITTQLSATAPYLDKTVDYGWLWFISELIFVVMKWIFTYVGNWGLAIILVTVLIKLVFYPLSAKSYLSMAKMRELQPKVAALKEKIGDDRQKLGTATMELYRKEKVNPLGGCLPIVVQIPVFIALYWVLMESVELRQAPFLFWIHDLSARDPYFVLPVLMGLSMFVQQRLNPAPPDPMQAKVMMFLPFWIGVVLAGEQLPFHSATMVGNESLSQKNGKKESTSLKYEAVLTPFTRH
jgi:YidC/Oxa1 family membrane protein insertase